MLLNFVDVRLLSPKDTGDLWAFEAEVKVILHALIFCSHFHLRHILIESDYALAVGWVNNKVNRTWKLIQDLNLIDLLYIEVESNYLGDYLAKSECNKRVPIWALLSN